MHKYESISVVLFSVRTSFALRVVVEMCYDTKRNDIHAKRVQSNSRYSHIVTRRCHCSNLGTPPVRGAGYFYDVGL